MAKSKGRDAVILVATSSPGATAVANHFGANFDENIKDTDSTTNDSGGSDEHEIISDDGGLSFEMYVDETDAGQNILRDAVEGRTFIFVRYRPKGTGAPFREHDCKCSVTMKRSTPKDGLYTASVTLKKTGAWTHANQT